MILSKMNKKYYTNNNRKSKVRKFTTSNKKVVIYDEKRFIVPIAITTRLYEWIVFPCTATTVIIFP